MSHRPIAILWLLTAIGVLVSGPALALDQLGIFWDTNYTQNATEVPAGSLVDAYLVLKDPSAPGVLGWECRIDHTGPGQFVNWALEGQTVNVGSGNEFSVGIGGDPLPYTPDGVLLATGQYYYPEVAPVRISLGPIYRASVPGEMSYIPSDEPDVLRVLGTVTGEPLVATINGDAPVVVVSPSSLNFGTVPLGTTQVRTITVSNTGGGTAVIFATLPADCADFSLVDYTGPDYLGAGDAMTIRVQYDARTLGTTFCEIDLGPGQPTVQVGGTAREAVTSWTVTPEVVEFGLVGIGAVASESVRITNTGETDISYLPVLVDPPASLSIVGVTAPSILQPGQTRLVNLEYEPQVVESFACLLELNGVLPDVLITGSSRDPIVSWDLTPSYPDFSQVEAGVLHTRYLTLRNLGEVPLELDLQVEAPADGFAIADPGPLTLYAGQSRSIVVTFRSDFPGSFHTRLLFGGPIPPLHMHASITLGEEACLITPAVLDYGEVVPGETYRAVFHVTNQHSAPLDVTPSYPGGALSIFGDPVTLGLGETVTYTVDLLAPGILGPFSTTIPLGSDVCADLPVSALVVEPSCLTAPGPVDFGIVAVDQVHELPLELQNPFNSPLAVDPVSGDPAFSLFGGPATIPPGGTVSYTLRFAPTAEGGYETAIDLGAARCDPVVVIGTAAPASCQLSATLLEFGTLPLGVSSTRYVDVVNTGPARFSFTPEIEGSGFSVDEGTVSLLPGAGATIGVTFRPLVLGSVQGTLGFGPGACGEVMVTGTGEAPIEQGTNRIGIYFDQDPYTTIEYETASGAPELVTCYLVLGDASDLGGVSAWECAFAIEGDVIVVGWDIVGNSINVGDPGEFIVGLAQPLPWSPQILLATGSLLATVPSSEGALLKLRPTLTPSVPGQMAYASGTDPGVLIPMIPATGSEVVAIIAGSSPLPVELPSPRARLAAGEVRLEWSLEGDAGDGCHLYRRGPDGVDTRLTDGVLTPVAGRFSFVDRPFGYAEGTLMAYSYAKVAGGIEGPRSPETEVRLTGLPALRTRLLANVPNPFNPSTEVRFRLRTPGRVRVAVYDMTGRLVRELVDASLGAGPHRRVWDGRDRGGRPVPSGTYYLRLETPDATDARKMMLLK